MVVTSHASSVSITKPVTSITFLGYRCITRAQARLLALWSDFGIFSQDSSRRGIRPLLEQRTLKFTKQIQHSNLIIHRKIQSYLGRPNITKLLLLGRPNREAKPVLLFTFNLMNWDLHLVKLETKPNTSNDENWGNKDQVEIEMEKNQSNVGSNVSGGNLETTTFQLIKGGSICLSGYSCSIPSSGCLSQEHQVGYPSIIRKIGCKL